MARCAWVRQGLAGGARQDGAQIGMARRGMERRGRHLTGGGLKTAAKTKETDMKAKEINMKPITKKINELIKCFEKETGRKIIDIKIDRGKNSASGLKIITFELEPE